MWFKRTLASALAAVCLCTGLGMTASAETFSAYSFAGGAAWEKTVNGSSIGPAYTKSGLESGKYRVKSVFTLTNKQGKTETITVYSDERSV